MELGNALDKLGVGLSRLLRYSFGGFLLIVLAAVVNPSDTGSILKEIPWQLAALSAVVVGAGLYAAHRSIVIPVHHLSLCFLLRVWEGSRGVVALDSHSPTRWLGCSSIGVPRFRRMLAYTLLRRSDFFSEQERKSLNVAHAEMGLVVMIAEGLGAAVVYVVAFPTKSQVGWLPLSLLSIVFLVASFPGPFGQHIIECMRFRRRPDAVKAKLLELGILPISESGQPHA